ncbi:MAG: hypothetical protein WC400_03405 [Patescibacteria group bacterium]
MNKFAKILLVVALPLLLTGCAPAKPVAKNTVSTSNLSVEQIDGLAKALTAAGAKEYGSQYCSACELQKKMFGAAWSNINFIECSLDANETQNATCKAAGIKVYPTWEFKGGSRLEGVQQLTVLAKKIGFSF